MNKPTLPSLFFGFMRIGCLSFGGAQAFARAVMVEQRRWLTEQEYAELLALAQVLPGPNVGNFAVMFGRRVHGLPGSLACVSGFFGMPLLMLIGLVGLYARFGDNPLVNAAMHGIAAAAAGMVLGTALRMASRLRPPPEVLALAAAVLAASLLGVPLPVIVLLAGPAGIYAALRRARPQDEANR